MDRRGHLSPIARALIPLRNDRGQTTIETAFGIAALIATLLVAIAALVAVATYLSALDSAGQLARATGRGDVQMIEAIRQQLPSSARVSTATNDQTVTISVAVPTPLLRIKASATALLEPS